MITTTMNEAPAAIAGTSFSGIKIFKCDVTLVRTAARTNPCVYLLQNGTIVNKWSGKQLVKTEAALNNLPVLPPSVDPPGVIMVPITEDSLKQQADTSIKK